MAEYSLPPLPYGYDALEPHLSREILELHHKQHHAAYVKGANETLAKLDDARRAQRYDSIGQLEKNLAFHVSGHVLHSLLWKNMSPDGGGSPEGELRSALDRDLGGVDGCRSQMTAAAAAVQGSGWGALSWEPLGRRLVVQQVFDHQGNIANGSIPILVVDMWEHAYYLQYQNRKNEWLKAFWELVDWKDVGERLARVQRIDIGL
jgi:Fe-Mn family superoxide dismutase